MQKENYSRDIYINGRFLTQRTSGSQRFAREVVKALDALLCEGSCELSERNWSIVVPTSMATPIKLRRIAIKVMGGARGHLWEQVVLPRAARGGILVNLTNGAPIIHSRSFVVIHDAAVFRTPDNYSFSYVFLHRLLGHVLSRTSHLGTVSEFSRRELSAIHGLDSSKIFIVPNSCEHLRDVIPDHSVLPRLELQRGQFFLMVGQSSPNKNFRTAMLAFTQLGLPLQKFVIVGASDSKVFRGGIDDIPEGVVIAGHLSDQELVALFHAATALIFPSLYEGFGIPPLEAMVHGCPVLASRIPAVEEVCGDAALFFDPKGVGSLVAAMRSIVDSPATRATLIAKGNARAGMYSWDRSANQLVQAIAKWERLNGEA